MNMKMKVRPASQLMRGCAGRQYSNIGTSFSAATSLLVRGGPYRAEAVARLKPGLMPGARRRRCPRAPKN